MDNASFHHLDGIKQSRTDAGVKLLYLPPYSPNFNPTEEFLAKLKAYVRKAWPIYEIDPDQGFHVFLRWCYMKLVQNSRVLKAISDMQV